MAALQFLTVIPLPWPKRVSAEDLGRSTAFFPLVGLIIGLVLVGLNWVFSLLMPAAVAKALLIVTLVVMTGALHVDGFLDTCDGIGGQKSVEERWQAMRDSHAGGFGVIGVVLLLLAKYASLNSIPDSSIMIALVMMPVISRWAMVYAIFAFRYARPSGLGRAFKEGTRWPSLVIATVITLTVVGILAHVIGLSIFIIIVAATAAFAAYLNRKFQGLTGDTYGAINEGAEVGVLLMVAMLAHTGLLR